MHSASTHIYSLSLHDALPIWSQDFRTEPYTVQSHQIMGTVLQSGPKNLRPDRNFSVRSSLDRKLRSGPASLLASVFNYWQLKLRTSLETDFTKQTSYRVYPCDKGHYKEVRQ